MTEEHEPETFAEYYDSFYRDKDQDDVGFYVERAKNADGKVLEIACGTGRIYLEMLKEGVDAYGIDISRDMIDQLEQKARDQGLEPNVEVADMKDFELEEDFDLIIIPFRSFLHNTTVDDQLDTLENIHDHLHENGQLVLNFFVPDYEFIAQNYGEVNERMIEKEGKEYRVTQLPRVEDPVEQISRIEYKIYDGDEVVSKSSFDLKFVSKNEFELLLRNTDFSTWNVYGGFELEELESPKQEMVWIVEK